MLDMELRYTREKLLEVLLVFVEWVVLLIVLLEFW